MLVCFSHTPQQKSAHSSFAAQLVLGGAASPYLLLVYLAQIR